MRRVFASYLYEQMNKNSDIYLITADLGYGLWDNIAKSFPDRFYNVGSSEMAMMGVGIGLAMEKKIPFVYSITPFALYRPFEMIRNYVNHEKIPVNIVGGGRDRDYGYLGFSHWAEEDIDVLMDFKNILLFKPESINDEYMKSYFSITSLKNFPTYINLKK